VYEERLKSNVAREQARKDLPLSTYTEAYWKIDLWNLLHFLYLRMDKHSQLEIRNYAEVIGHQIVSRWVPIAWQAFLDYQVNGLTLSSRELKVLRHVFKGDMVAASHEALDGGWLKKDKGGIKTTRNREREEFEEKMREHFDISVVWRL
jgi:thymidylate synthase (FAD)